MQKGTAYDIALCSGRKTDGAFDHKVLYLLPSHLLCKKRSEAVIAQIPVQAGREVVLSAGLAGQVKPYSQNSLKLEALAGRGGCIKQVCVN